MNELAAHVRAIHASSLTVRITNSETSRCTRDSSEWLHFRRQAIMLLSPRAKLSSECGSPPAAHYPPWASQTGIVLPCPLSVRCTRHCVAEAQDASTIL